LRHFTINLPELSGYPGYNNMRLHSAIGYVAPEVKLKGNEEEIFAERDQKLEFAREMRKAKRNAKRSTSHEEVMV